MSWLLSLFISSVIGLLTFAAVVIVLRRQRRRFERLLADFGGQQLVTNKRLAEILLQHQKRADKTDAYIDTVKLVAEASRRDADYAARQTDALMRYTGAMDAENDSDDDTQPAKTTRPKWVN